MLILFTIAFLSMGCKSDKSRITELLKTVDTVKLKDYKQDRETYIKSNKGIKIFTDIIHLKKENLPYSTMFREMEYYSKGKLVLKAKERKEGIEYIFNGETYNEGISEEARRYQGDPFLIKHQDFTPTPNNSLEARIYRLKLQHIVFGCTCADWATAKDLSAVEKHQLNSNDIFMFLEPADKNLTLPDTLGYEGDLIEFTGQFYTKKTYPKGYDTEGTVNKAKVFRYSKFKVLKSEYREAEKLRIISKNKFNVDSAFQILSSYRSITKQSSAQDTNMCAGWTISKKNLYKLIKHSKLIGGTEWDLSFDVLPCIMKGQLKQNGKLYHFEVNGGSWLYLKSRDTTVILGDYDTDDQKYFIQGPMPD